MSKTSKIIYFFISLIFLTIVDVYFSDFIIRNGYKLKENPILDFTFIQNQGAAFSLFDGFKIFLITFSAIAIICILFSTFKRISKISTLSLFLISLLSAGICCNMGERILLGCVRDYIKLNFIDFPVFNISDVYINIAVFALIFVIAKNRFYKIKK